MKSLELEKNSSESADLRFNSEPAQLFENRIVSDIVLDVSKWSPSEKLELIGANKSEWLSTREAAIFMRRFTAEGQPGEFSLRNDCSKGLVPFHKPRGRLKFKRSELQKINETSRQGMIYGNYTVSRRKKWKAAF